MTLLCCFFYGTLDSCRLNEGIWFLRMGSDTCVVPCVTHSVMYFSCGSTGLLYRTHSFGYFRISDVSSVKYQKVATIFCEWISKYSNKSPYLLSKCDLHRLSMYICSCGACDGLCPCVFLGAAIQAINLKFLSDPRQFRSCLDLVTNPLLFCSYAWSIAIAENGHFVLCTRKPPWVNSCYVKVSFMQHRLVTNVNWHPSSPPPVSVVLCERKPMRYTTELTQYYWIALHHHTFSTPALNQYMI